MRIHTNTLSLVARTNLGKSVSSLGTAIERLSSGLRINSARDDAAGQAIANRMTSSIRGQSVAKRNTEDAQALLNTAEGAANEVNSILQRMRELAVQQRNGTNSESDYESIEVEMEQLREEINRIGATSAFGNMLLADGEKSLDIQIGSQASEPLNIGLRPLSTGVLGLDRFSIPMGPALKEITVDSGPNAGVWKVEFKQVVTADGDVLKEGAAEAYYGVPAGSITMHQRYSLDGEPIKDRYIVKIGSKNYDRPIGGMEFNPATGVATYMVHNHYRMGDINDVDNGIELKDQYLPNPQAGWTTDGQMINFIEWNDNYIIAKETGTLKTGNHFYLSGPLKNTIDLYNPDPISQIDMAMSQIDEYRTYLGATQNRLDSIVSGLDSSNVALEAARSRIQDADYALEMSNLTRNQILQQAGQAVLAQANQIPQGAVKLLQSV